MHCWWLQANLVHIFYIIHYIRDFQSHQCLTVSRIFQSSYLPLPDMGKEGKCGDTPHPVKGLPSLETLLRLTFEKLRNRSQVCDEGDVAGVPNYQYLCYYIISLNRSTGKLRRISRSVSITCHWDAWRSLSILHYWHSRHVLHWPGSKVCGAIGTECPAQFK